jgi:hypothetical protein
MTRAILIGFLGFVTCAVRSGAQPTYAKEVSRIFQAKCQGCHRDGDIAPFALKDYDTAVLWAGDIRRAVANRVMPPWKPVPGHGEFRDSYALSDDERRTILDWIENGMPAGDPNDMPEPLPDKGEWPLGEPDAVLSMTQQYTPPIGSDVYRCFVLPTKFDKTQYLSAIDVAPGNRQIVHHVLLFADTKGTADQLDGQDGQPGYTCFGGPGIPLSLNSSLGGWAPGQRTHFLPDGIGVEWPKNSKIVMQVHYFPIGRTGPDQTRIGLYFSKVDIQQRLFMIPILNTTFTIPPGSDKYDVKAQFPVIPFLDGKVIWVYPHMHLLGREINLEVTDIFGETRPMIYENDWDFNWQGAYTYVDPLVVKSGSTIKLTCTYNNSDTNLKNPNNPLAPVRWGERTTDEMCLAFLGVTLDYEKLLPLRKVSGR